MDLPLLGMGTWEMGGRFEKDRRDFEVSVQALRHGLSLGIRLIDTAEAYGNGGAEEIVGEAIKGIPRNDIFLVSKVWKEHMRFDEVLRACTQSLSRLKTDYLDLFLIHWPNPEVPLRETLFAMKHLVSTGKVRHIGVSNFSVPLMAEAQKHLDTVPLYANQIEYSLASRAAEKEVIPYCIAHGVRIMAYRPLAKGVLAGPAADVLMVLCEKYGKPPAAIALHWIISQGIAAIPKAGSRAHLEENIQALGWRMEKEDYENLSHYFKTQI